MLGSMRTPYWVNRVHPTDYCPLSQMRLTQLSDNWCLVTSHSMKQRRSPLFVIAQNFLKANLLLPGHPSSSE